MPRTIFSKLITIFVVIIVISFSIAGAMLYYFLGNFVIEEKVNALRTNGDRINALLSVYLGNVSDAQMIKLLKSVIKTYSEDTSSLIWVVDPNGNILLADEVFIPQDVMTKLRDSSGKLRLPDSKQYKSYLQEGKEEIEQGDFYGLFSDTKVAWLTVIKPYVFTNGAGQNIPLAIYLNTRIPEVQRAQTNVFRFFMISVTISIIISIILVYFFSLKISRPLAQISSMATEIAGGEFKKRIKIKASDEIRQLAENFNNMAEALLNLEEMRKGFIANVSHELRTPMTTIRGFIDGILDGTVPVEKQNDYLKIVREEIERLNRLVNALLDLARMESGEQTLKFSRFNINELLRRCIIRFENLIVKKNIQVEAKFYEDDIFVFADVDSIERVIINLLHNAIKFTNQNGNILIEVKKQTNKAFVTVGDDGIGISADELNLIWERFYKSDKSRGIDRSGTGLGLAIVKNIINEHKQNISVESEIGKGTKFTFSLEEAI